MTSVARTHLVIRQVAPVFCLCQSLGTVEAAGPPSGNQTFKHASIELAYTIYMRVKGSDKNSRGSNIENVYCPQL